MKTSWDNEKLQIIWAQKPKETSELDYIYGAQENSFVAKHSVEVNCTTCKFYCMYSYLWETIFW